MPVRVVVADHRLDVFRVEVQERGATLVTTGSTSLGQWQQISPSVVQQLPRHLLTPRLDTGGMQQCQSRG